MDPEDDAPRDALPASASQQCSRCGGTVKRIVYGLPGPDLFEAAERGEVLLGGCVVFDRQPISRCMTCGAERRRPSTGSSMDAK